jgi:hypothetical protein
MSLVRFKLKKANALTKLANFHEKPSWGDLASEISRLFGVPPDYVGVAFIDKDKDTISLTNEQELQAFYDSPDHSPEVIKFVVYHVRAPDGECAFA